MAATIRIPKERKELIAKYATASVFLYGMLSVDEFVRIFNRYEPSVKTTLEEAFLALQRLAKTNDVEYSLKNNIISGPEFQPCFDDYEDDVKYFRSAQRGKPRYLPDKEEFLRYLESSYREPEKPYSDLKAYIFKHKLTNRGEGIRGVDGDLLDLHEFIQSGILSAGQELEFFTDKGYSFKDMNAANAFMQLVMNVHNNTRMFENNGFTPNEIFERFERPKLKLLPKEPFVFGNLTFAKPPSKNGACPCGSGKKYKRCCGK